MPISFATMAPLMAAGLGAAAGSQNDMMNNINQQMMNQQQLAYNREMYQRQLQDQKEQYNLQRTHGLADYHMQNQYNSPLEMMKRLKLAGINPVTAFGNINQSAGPVRSSQQGVPTPHSYSPQTSKYTADFSNIPGALSQIYDIRLKEAQTDNLKAANTVAVQEAILKAAQTSKTAMDTARTKFDLQMAERLKLTTIEKAEQEVRKIGVSADFTQHADTRADQSQKAQLALTAAQLKNIQTDVRLKEIDLNLKKLGLNPSDPTYVRAIGQALSDPRKTWNNMKEWFGDLFK